MGAAAVLSSPNILQNTSFPTIHEAIWRCDMSQVDSAVLLDAGESASSPLPPSANLAADQVLTLLHDAAEKVTVAIPQPPDPIEQTSLNLDGPADSPADSIVSPPPTGEDPPNVAPAAVQKGTLTTLAEDPAYSPATTAVNKGSGHNPVAPPTSIVRPEIPRDTVPSQAAPSVAATATTHTDSHAAKQNRHLSFPHLFPSLHRTSDGPATIAAEGDVNEGKMVFGHTITSAAQRRRNYANTNAVTDYEADLTSKDRTKQKEAVKKFLSERVKEDWTWEWPRPDPNSAAEDSPTQLEPSTTADSIDNVQKWKERDEWLSNASDSGEDPPVPAAASLSPSIPSPNSELSKTSPFRFESPDGVGQIVKKSLYERKRRRKRRLADEMAWNNGLRCFTTRRDAWTCARRVSRISSVGLSPVKAPKRASLSSEDGGSSTAIEQEDDEWEDDIEIPIALPLLPPENAMRASILPASYNTIYDKVVVQALTPSCPMNLKDVTRSCVQGWKRDGEWPPKSMPEPPKRKARKLSVASLFGLEKVKSAEKDKAGNEKDRSPTSASGIRRSLQKILSLGHGGKELDTVKPKESAPGVA